MGMLGLGCGAVERLLMKSPVLVYGPAASGKTNLILHILTRLARRSRVVLLSTEGFTPVPRLLQLCKGPCMSNMLFYSVFDTLDLLEKLVMLPRGVVAVGIDSINWPFRGEVGLDVETVKAVAAVAAVAAKLASRGVYVIASSQVHEREGEVEAVASRLLKPYFTVIVRLEVGEEGRRFLVERPARLEGRLEISRDGVRLVCS